MKNRKRMTGKQLAANRDNAKKSTGPKTRKGKDMSKCNAIKHGCNCKGLYVPEKDRGEFLRLEKAVRKQLRPTTELLRFAAKRVIAAMWRCELALRLEADHLHQKFASDSASVPKPENLTMTEWYAANPLATAKAIRLIDTMLPHVKRTGHIHVDWIESVKTAFGPDFYEDLVKWEAAQMTDLIVAEMVRSKAELFDSETVQDSEDKPLDDSDPEGQRNDDSEVRRRHKSDVSLDPVMLRDPKQQADLMVKLLEAKRQQLLDAQHLFKHLSGQLAGGQGYYDSPHRFVTAAFRELEKAVAFYKSLLEK